MKIFDESLTTELENPDLEKGRLKPARRLVEHHEAVERVFHYEVMEGTVSLENPKGLRHEVEDVAAKAAWDEYEDVQKYVPYTEAELAKIAADKKAEEDRKAAEAEEMRKMQEAAEAEAAAKAAAEAEQAEKIARIDAIDAQVTYTAMMTDTLMVDESESGSTEDAGAGDTSADGADSSGAGDTADTSAESKDNSGTDTAESTNAADTKDTTATDTAAADSEGK